MLLQQQQYSSQPKKSSGYGISDLLQGQAALPTISTQASLGTGVVTSPAANGLSQQQQQAALLQQQLLQQEMLQQNFFGSLGFGVDGTVHRQ
jgi:hypothetical protein